MRGSQRVLATTHGIDAELLLTKGIPRQPIMVQVADPAGEAWRMSLPHEDVLDAMADSPIEWPAVGMVESQGLDTPPEWTKLHPL